MQLEDGLDPLPTASCIKDIPCDVDHLNGEDTNTSYWYEFTDAPGPDDTSFSMGSIALGQTRTLWLTSDPNDPFDDGGSGIVTWYGTPFTLNFAIDASQPVNVEIARYYKEPPDTILVHRTYKQYTDSNNTETINPADTIYNGMLGFIIIRPYDNDVSDITIDSYTQPFYKQGVYVESHASYLGSGIGQQSISKRLRVIRWYEEAPAYMNFVMYSGGNL